MIPHYRFAVDTRPFCAWGSDLTTHSRQFIESLDPEYYAYLARVLDTPGDSVDKHRSGTAIRLAYHNGLETLFTVLCATLQAPACVPAWATRCQTTDLRSLVRKIGTGQPILSYLPLPEPSWRSVAAIVLGGIEFETEELRSTQVEAFGGVLRRLAGDLLSDDGHNEYNSIKHGMRVAPGGMKLLVGLEQVLGQRAASEAMKVVGESEYGSRYPVVEKLRDKGMHFRLAHHSLAWSRDACRMRLQVVSKALLNVKSYLRLWNDLVKRAEFWVPEDLTDYTRPWEGGPSLRSMNFSVVVKPEDVHAYSAQEILSVYKAVGDGPSPEAVEGNKE